MRLHPSAAYWDRGVRNVPDMTGAKHLLDAHDLKAVCTALGLSLPLGSVVDVGCGTGRLAALATKYVGYDISPSAIDYCQGEGLDARLMTSLDDITATGDLVTCISVFTHISRADRQDYLMAFRTLAPRLLVDIIPGDGSGEVALWTAVPEQFEADLDALGYRIVSVVDQAWDTHQHRYYLAEVVW